MTSQRGNRRDSRPAGREHDFASRHGRIAALVVRSASRRVLVATATGQNGRYPILRRTKLSQHARLALRGAPNGPEANVPRFLDVPAFAPCYRSIRTCRDGYYCFSEAVEKIPEIRTLPRYSKLRVRGSIVSATGPGLCVELDPQQYKFVSAAPNG